MFVRDFGDDVIQVGVVHTETIAEPLARLLDGEKVLLGLALNEKHVGKGSKVVAALHELPRVVDDGLGAGVGVVMLVLVEEDAHEGGSESDHLFVDAGIGSIKVKFGIFVVNVSLVKDADEANIADAPLEASVVAREIRRLVEVAEKGGPLGLKALDGVGEQQSGPLNTTASEVLDDARVYVGATVGLVGVEHAAAPPVEHGRVSSDRRPRARRDDVVAHLLGVVAEGGGVDDEKHALPVGAACETQSQASQEYFSENSHWLFSKARKRHPEMDRRSGICASAR